MVWDLDLISEVSDSVDFTDFIQTFRSAVCAAECDSIMTMNCTF